MRTRPHGRPVLVLLVTLCGLVTARADSPPGATSHSLPHSSISDLLRQLGADRFKDRQLAEDELVLRGESVLPALRETIRATNDAEVRSRCETAIERIADELAIGPTRVTLHFKDTPAVDAYAELAREARVELRPYPTNLWEGGSWENVTLDLERQPFWEAVKQLGAQTGLSLRGVTPEELRLTVRGRAARAMGGAEPACDNVAVSGPFMLTASRISRSRSVDLEQGDDQGDFSVAIAVLAEPKLRVLRTEPIVLHAADDDAGNSLLSLVPPGVRGGRETLSFAQRGGSAWQTTVKLRDPPDVRLGTRIVRLKASMAVTLQTRADTVEIDDLLEARDLEDSIAGLDFTLNEMRRTGPGEQYELHMTLRAADRTAGDLESVRQQLVGSSIRVLDGDDRPMALRGSEQSLSNGQIELVWRFARERDRTAPRRQRDSADGELAVPPMKLRWEMPLESKRVNIPFEFRDLPIP